MSTESPAQDGRRSAPSAAERMRAVRKRRRLGSFFVRIELNEPDIDGQALFFPRSILRAEYEADRPFREALAFKRERLAAKRRAKLKGVEEQ